MLTKQRRQAEQRSTGPVRIVSIYEAGRDGFWLHRWLQAQQIESHVVDPASILGPKRRRQAKTDRIDGAKLVRSLAAWLSGEPGVRSMAAPASVTQEDYRRLSRERDELVGERTRLSNRINGLLANQGIAGFKPLQKGALQDSTICAPAMGMRWSRICAPRSSGSCSGWRCWSNRSRRWRRRATRCSRKRSADTGTTEAASREAAIARQLFRLRSIGPEFATVLPAECFCRAFDNRRQVASFAGLAPTPWASGSVEREQGISKAGNRRLRKTMIEA